MKESWGGPLEKIDDNRYRIPRNYKQGMRVDGVIYADSLLIQSIKTDRAPEQVANVAFLPGIIKASMAMPDIHWGYGFPIGGVAATDVENGGVVSPGGVGYDINCGVRLIKTNLVEQDVKDRMKELVAAMFSQIPCGVGVRGKISFNRQQERKIIEEGSSWVVKQGYGRKEDVVHTESGGCLPDADPDALSDRAYERGSGQCGTLGAGNHFMEVQVIDQVYNKDKAAVFGLEKGQITVMIHCGSRGLGHQVCDDNLRKLQDMPRKYGIILPDRQLVCAPVTSKEGQRYLGAMRGAANFAWANRQILLHLIRMIFERFFGMGPRDLGMDMIYDVAHNIAKIEKHSVHGKEIKLCVHRKGATRAFPPDHPDIPEEYRKIGQPVLIPGDMGRYSFLLVGTQKAMEETFGSTCHGAGRLMSRKEAIRQAQGRSIQRELAEKGIVAMARGRKGLDEEQPAAYKDVNMVVNVVQNAGISEKICRMRPLGVIKG